MKISLVSILWTGPPQPNRSRKEEKEASSRLDLKTRVLRSVSPALEGRDADAKELDCRRAKE